MINEKTKMNIQIIGTKKCRETQKAERFFRERNIPFHFRDLSEKGLAQGELENITRKINVEDLIGKESKRFKRTRDAVYGFQYRRRIIK